MSSEDTKEKKVQAALKRPVQSATSELERIFLQHHRRVLQAAYRITGSPADAEDVLQTVFLRLLRKDACPGRAEDMGSYLYRAAVNASIDLLRSQKTRQNIDLEMVAPRLVQSDGVSPEESREARELEEWLRAALTRLSPQSAEVFALRFLEGLDNQEIAEIIDTSPGVVAVVLHRTRSRLRDELRSFLGGAS